MSFKSTTPAFQRCKNEQQRRSYGRDWVAVRRYAGKSRVDGMLADHWVHNRTESDPTLGVMHWYTKERGDGTSQLVQTRYDNVDGSAGVRDFSAEYVSPAPAGSFDPPSPCPPQRADAFGTWLR